MNFSKIRLVFIFGLITCNFMLWAQEEVKLDEVSEVVEDAEVKKENIVENKDVEKKIEENPAIEDINIGDLENEASEKPADDANAGLATKPVEKSEGDLESKDEDPVGGPATSDIDSISLDDLETTDDPADLKDEKEKSKVSEPSDQLEEFKIDTDGELAKQEKLKNVEENAKKITESKIFDVGKEERELLAKAQNIQGQISDTEWNEVSTAAKVDSYTVVKDDWLFKISKKLFGSGYYYPKIWSLNTFITNPHYIEPGMVLSFTTGSGSSAPEVKLGKFTDQELGAAPGSIGNTNSKDLSNFGEDAVPNWIGEKKQLTNQGIFFQYSSEETMDDLLDVGAEALNREYENYEPSKNEDEMTIPSTYDKLGFDKSSKIVYAIKEGFYLSTFLTTNIVQDFGSIVNGPDENIFFTKGNKAYVQFNENMRILSGDLFSIYTSSGKVRHENSDREGYKYSIVGQIKVVRKIKEKWEVEFVDVTGNPQREDRITAYTPKIDRITKTFNNRMIEAAIISSYNPGQSILGFGDVIYLDRGRADGLEMGNVLETYGFKDRLTGKNISDLPTYKTGELTVITLTDNFATALVTRTIKDFYMGDIAITKTKEAHLRELRAREARKFGEREKLAGKELDELDVELNLDNLNDDLLKQADKIQLTDDELAELERQERERSVIKDTERDLKSLERLESEIEQAESILKDAKLDEDKLLEGENLNEIEKKSKNIEQDSLNEIEENLGKRYVDEDLNSKENPYGLSEFDIEEVDELLNVDKNKGKEEK